MVNPEYLALWKQIMTDRDQPVSTPTGQRIKAAIKAVEGCDFEDRLKSIMAACEAESPGLYAVISAAGFNFLNEADHAHKESIAEGMRKAEGMQSDTMRTHFLKQLADRHEKFVRSGIVEQLKL